MLALFVTISSASGSAIESTPTQLVINARTFEIFYYSNLQMLRALANKTDDEAFNCWSNVDGEEVLNDEVE